MAANSNFPGQCSTDSSDVYANTQRENKNRTSAVKHVSDGENSSCVNDQEIQIDLSEIYQALQDENIDIEERMKIFNEIKEYVRTGKVPMSRIANYHIYFCTLQAMNFSSRPGIGVLKNTEKLLVPALKFLREGLFMADKKLVDVAIRSHLLPCLAKLLMTFAERTDLMSKNLSKMCAVDSLLGHTRVIPPFDILNRLLEVPKIPESVAKTNVAKVVDLQHRYDCECVDCKDNPNKQKCPSINKLTMRSGIIGTILYPLRSLPRHIAAICPVRDYWEMLEGRSKKIGDSISLPLINKGRYDVQRRNNIRQVFVPGQQVIVLTEFLHWIGYEATSPTAPKLPPYLRGFVIGECELPILSPYIGLWLPDYASQALSAAENLHVLPSYSKLRVLPSLLFLADACPPTPDEAVEVAVDIIYLLLLHNASNEQIQVLLDDKGPWKTVQMLKFLKGEPKAKFLYVINKITKDFERGSRSVVACCLHALLADWTIWSVYTQPMSEFEKEVLMEGLTQTIPRIDVRKWPKRPILLQAVQALLKDASTGNLQTLLLKCKEMLSWDPTNRSVHNRREGGNVGPGRPWQNRQNRHSNFSERNCHDRDRGLPNRRAHDHSKEKEEKENIVYDQSCNDQLNQEDDRDEQGMLRQSEYYIGRRPRTGETWFSVTEATHKLVAPSPTEPTEYLPVICSKVVTMIRNLLYKPARQGVNCELVKANSLRDVRQPMLARLMCGMLNSGGGKIYIGLGEESLVQGVRASRPERDSFSQGVLDVTTYNIDPRLPPFAFKLESRMVIKSADHVPEGDWSRYVFILDVKPSIGAVYQVLPEKHMYVRRSPDGVTVLMLAPTKNSMLEGTTKE